MTSLKYQKVTLLSAAKYSSRMAMSRVDQIDEDTLRGIWTTLPTQLCNRHRDKARNKKPTPDNPRPTDWKIEDLRKEHYSGGYPDSSYFKRHITELARRHPEIQVEDDVIRLTHQGILYCVRNVRGFEKDF